MKIKMMLLMLVSGSVFAQEYAQQLTLSHAVTAGIVSDQKAVESIVASNQVNQEATAFYTAGKSVSLRPGFVALAGSVFKATVEPVISSGSGIDGLGLSARAYPNPFVEQTTIEYTLPLGGRIHHKLMNAKGQVLRQSEATREQAAGRYQTQIEGGSLPAGVYLYQLQVGNQIRTLRLIRK
jgi:hypothetical protein